MPLIGYNHHTANQKTQSGQTGHVVWRIVEPTNGPAKAIIRQTLARYREKVIGLLELGIQQGRIVSRINTEAASVLYLGAIQGLVVQAMVSGELHTLEQAAPRIFKLYSASFQEMPDDPEK